jgi:CRP-like cAMP-binding protein
VEAILTLIEKTAYLKSSPLLSVMPIEGLAQLASRSQELHLEEGEFAYREGEVNRGTFLVVDGLIQVGQGSALQTIRGAGEGFGELSLDEGETHRTSAMAIEHSHLLNVSNDDLFETILDFPEVGLALTRFMSGRLVDVGRRVHDLEQQIAKLNRVLRSHGIEVPVENEAEQESRGTARTAPD